MVRDDSAFWHAVLTIESSGIEPVISDDTLGSNPSLDALVERGNRGMAVIVNDTFHRIGGFDFPEEQESPDPSADIMTPLEVLEQVESEAKSISKLDLAKKMAVEDISQAIQDYVVRRVEVGDQKALSALEYGNDAAYFALRKSSNTALRNELSKDAFGNKILELFDIEIELYGKTATVYTHAFDNAMSKIASDYNDPLSIPGRVNVAVEESAERRARIREKEISRSNGRTARTSVQGKETAPLYIPLEGRQYDRGDIAIVSIGKIVEANQEFISLNQRMLGQGYDRVRVQIQPTWQFNPNNNGTFAIKYQKGNEVKTVQGAVMYGSVMSVF